MAEKESQKDKEPNSINVLFVLVWNFQYRFEPLQLRKEYTCWKGYSGVLLIVDCFFVER